MKVLLKHMEVCHLSNHIISSAVSTIPVFILKLSKSVLFHQGGRKLVHIKMTLFGLYLIHYQPHLSIFEYVKSHCFYFPSSSRPFNFLTISTKSCMRFRAPQNSNHVWGFKNRAPSLGHNIFKAAHVSNLKNVLSTAFSMRFILVPVWGRRLFPKLVPGWNA
jgi:hypothetical protein